MAVAPPIVKLHAPSLAAPLAAVAGVVIIALVGCTSKQAARLPVSTPIRGSEMDASYDWRGQVTLPFGVLFKSSPVPLHEVLLFHDESPGVARNAADADNKDCYAIDGTPPRLVGQTPDSYLLCFDHDRLNRIESSVRLAPASARQVFARACASWQATAPLAPAAADVCEGHSGSTTFEAHLVGAAGEPSTLSLVLTNASPAP